MLTIQKRREGNTALITVSGKMSFDVIHDLNNCLQDLFTNQRPEVLVINLTEVGHMDSSGIGLLVSARNIMNRGMGHLYLCGLSPNVTSIFSRMSLLSYFSIFNTEQEALLNAHQLQQNGQAAGCVQP